MNVRAFAFALSLSVVVAACGESHTTDMDAGDVIVFDATFPDTGPDAAGLNNVGEPCRGDMDCVGAATSCVEELPGGYCSELCGAEEDCPTGSSCVQVDRTTSICLDQCDPSGTDECRAGYGCSTEIGVCIPGCEENADCDDGTECDPTGGFSGEGRCFTPGSGYGDACVSSQDCPSSGFCLDEGRAGFPGGYCAGFGCDLDANTGCDEGGVCLPGFRGGLCYQSCASDDECRSGYECRPDVSFPERSSCRPAFDPDDLGQICSAGRGSCNGFCLSEGNTGWPDSYCVATGCDPEGDSSDCPSDGVCIETGAGGGICLDGCADVGDCRAGYDCRPSTASEPTSPLACVPGCDTDAVCGNDEFVCNLGTGLCTEPFDGGALGEPCTGGDECVGGRCVDEANDGWPAGTCTYPGCRLTGEGREAPCPTGSVCVDDGEGDAELGVCVDSCTVDGAACRPGYACLPVDPDVTDGPTGCQPRCTTDSCGGGRSCNADTGRCE